MALPSGAVFMGMGEPLLNAKAVVRAVHFLTTQLKVGARSITISTVGVHTAIPKLAQHKLQCTLAVSLHAPTQELREQLVPSARVYPLEQLLRDCAHYFRATSRRVSFEYTLMAGVNDAVLHVRPLTWRCH
jgi:23S rRNA (adenine2503-C2)-methyltransferase